MARLCRKCKVNPALFDGVLCADCRGESQIPEMPERISPPIHNRPANKYIETRGASGRTSGYSNSWRGLTKKQIDKLQEIHNNKCAICNKKRFLVLDHDHKTGKVRGYLCRGCNTKLSGFDNPEFVKRATEYLKNPPANNL